jgi:23S rRNA pseudouridine1911/1915/1917 synthase
VWRDWFVWDDRALIQKVAAADDARAKRAESRYQIVEPLNGASLVEVRLVTGKRNQIRLQAALRGHPLVGEQRYTGSPNADGIPFPRQALHAWRLGFRHPASGETVQFEAPVPRDLQDLIARCRLPQRENPPTKR